MWLIPRRTNGLGSGRIPLPQPVRDALVRWYAGKGSRHDEEAGIMLVQQARIGEKWIACDRSEEHTSELQSLMRSSYDVLCLKKKRDIHLKQSDHISTI